MSTDGKNLNAPDIMRGLIKYSVIALGTIAGLVILTVGLLQAPSLRQAVLSFALTEINKGDTKIAIGDLSGQWPSHIHLTQVTVSDADGIWLSVDEADINWSPLSLLRGQVFVEDFSAQGVAVARLPSSGDNAEETSPGPRISCPRGQRYAGLS
jgi:translocation and assembly module TamB